MRELLHPRSNPSSDPLTWRLRNGRTLRALQSVGIADWCLRLSRTRALGRVIGDNYFCRRTPTKLQSRRRADGEMASSTSLPCMARCREPRNSHVPLEWARRRSAAQAIAGTCAGGHEGIATPSREPLPASITSSMLTEVAPRAILLPPMAAGRTIYKQAPPSRRHTFGPQGIHSQAPILPAHREQHSA